MSTATSPLDVDLLGVAESSAPVDPVPPTASPVVPVEPAAGALFERLLRDPAAIAAVAATPGGAAALVPPLVRIAAVGAAVYGLAIGLPGGVFQAGLTAVKLPIVLIGAACLTLPILHVACHQVGVRTRIDQLGALVLQALATSTVTMACLAPLVTVCWLTVSVDAFSMDPWFVVRRVILAGLGVATVGCLVGAARLVRVLPIRALVPWTASFGLAALQLTWLLRPVVGTPDGIITVLRPLESNALTEVLSAVVAVLTGVGL
jgi:cytochrome bd-type quinol oxidase subunit 2